jgi:hypothetical protein
MKSTFEMASKRLPPKYSSTSLGLEPLERIMRSTGSETKKNLEKTPLFFSR